jgi:hypothetical protein
MSQFLYDLRAPLLPVYTQPDQGQALLLGPQLFYSGLFQRLGHPSTTAGPVPAARQPVCVVCQRTRTVPPFQIRTPRISFVYPFRGSSRTQSYTVHFSHFENQCQKCGGSASAVNRGLFCVPPSFPRFCRNILRVSARVYHLPAPARCYGSNRCFAFAILQCGAAAKHAVYCIPHSLASLAN